jgi:hypothetical protein
MLTHDALEGEDARAAVLSGPGGPADTGERTHPAPDRVGDRSVGDHTAVTHDHGGLPAVRGKADLNYVRHT